MTHSLVWWVIVLFCGAVEQSLHDFCESLTWFIFKLNEWFPYQPVYERIHTSCSPSYSIWMSSGVLIKFISALPKQYKVNRPTFQMHLKSNPSCLIVPKLTFQLIKSFLWVLNLLTCVISLVVKWLSLLLYVKKIAHLYVLLKPRNLVHILLSSWMPFHDVNFSQWSVSSRPE